ncbi:hypothetical protein LWP59_29545 [Amycolatopsis acidiphila]|uniref:DUF3159 domain-containing protein n=1 Tax=Amycolatopsis acidiphila TaxID=715473 RepID=A0A558A7H2_9PSEU|nr:hypothetical protein [Amycolatopsis acidiphila]TVT20213.1 hypothetical protein FNH06_21520 [Amycolatopsis acidiphila]UIJ58238.1 hypothetical protein LWP59_29545 [Amycolatopsis acidiphila]GHG69242.1 hypothetical protein GCM10017788_29350 [Amycolatopsis acidiphila]
MNYLRSFAPWIVYAAVATQLDWRYSALVGLLLSAGLVVWERRERRPWDSMVIELSAAVFFGLLAVFAFADPGSAASDQVVTMSSAWLALTAWGSLVIGRPFTLGIARQMVQPQLWRNPLFRRTNVVITAVWASAFTIEALALGFLLAFAPHATAAVVTFKVAGFAVPVLFTIRYPRIVRARALKEPA